MAIIDQEGLFRGKRLRKCSANARWRWPYLFLLSNGYARIELDYECIADEFSSFRESAPTPDELRETFAEFRANHLIYVYEFNDQEWGQWDTRRSLLKEYKTAADKGSPAPPELEYRQWLIEQHGNEWSDFHWNKDLAEGTFDADSPKTLPNVDQPLPKVFEQIQEVPCGVGVGEGDGKGKQKIASDFNSTEGAQYVCQQLELAGTEMRWLVRDVIDGELKKSAGPITAIAEAMVAAWHKYSTLRKGMKYTKGVKAFFGEAGFWKDEGRWMDGDAKSSNAVPARSAIERHREHLAQEQAQ